MNEKSQRSLAVQPFGLFGQETAWTTRTLSLQCYPISNNLNGSDPTV